MNNYPIKNDDYYIEKAITNIRSRPKQTMNDYEKLKEIIENDPKNMFKYKPTYTNAPTVKGWMQLPLLEIIEDDSSCSKKGLFVVQNTSLPYTDNKCKLQPYIHVFLFDPKRTDKKRTPEAKFATLTHEYGHFISWKNKMPPKNYIEVLRVFSLGKESYHRLNDVEKNWILQEEQRAWAEGIKFVKSKGFKLYPDFYKEKRNALN